MSERRRFWEPEIETAPLETLRKIQLEKLKALIRRVYEKSAYYRRKFDEAGVKPEDIQTLEDFQRLPLTEYTQDMSPEDLLCVPFKEVTTILSTSGTTGPPKLVYVTDNDLETWKNLLARFAVLYGIGESDVFLVTFPFPSLFEAFASAGAKVIPFTYVFLFLDNELSLMERAKATGMMSSPGLFLTILKRAKELGIDFKQMGMRRVMFGGESWSSAYRRRMEEDLGMKFYDIYGIMEIGHPGGECVEQKGIHIWDDLFVVEILDPETGKPLPPLEPGEIVITPLWREAMPLIRYRTGDVAMRLEYEPCPCGRTMPKISRLKGRAAHMIKVEMSGYSPLISRRLFTPYPN